MKPHSNNFCGGNFQDWLEVYLTPKCNGKCSWCVDKEGWCPEEKVPWYQLASSIKKSKAKNIILLGGEPTLYPRLQQLITAIKDQEKRVYITTNGSRLTPAFCRENLKGINGINISIHHYNQYMNRDQVGFLLSKRDIVSSIITLHEQGATVRLNCNCIRGFIDSREKVEDYIRWGWKLGVDSIRFAELKLDDKSFVDFTDIFQDVKDINNNPFLFGCNINTTILGMPINLRQMCGFQTSKRPKPTDPEISIQKKVLYPDGKLYNGWQQKENKMNKREKGLVKKIIKRYKDGEISEDLCLELIAELVTQEKTNEDSGGACHY